MIRFEHTEVFNFEGALRGMRNSWESWDKSDSAWSEKLEVDTKSGRVWTKYNIGPNDLALAIKLSKAGSDHAKFLRQILISVDIIAPEYWWKEADTYKVGTVANSTSMMHKLGSRELTADDFGFDNPNGPIAKYQLHLLNTTREVWIESGKKKPSPEWRIMNQHIPISFLYRRTFTANYQVLKSMYFARKAHRLEEWHEVAKWISSLPYSELITLKEVAK